MLIYFISIIVQIALYFFFSSPYWAIFFSLRHFAITDYRMEVPQNSTNIFSYLLFPPRAGHCWRGNAGVAGLVYSAAGRVFSTPHPLASVGSRLVTIVLLLMFLALWLVNWSMSIIGVTVLCLVIGFVSPSLAFGDVHPFAPLWLRLTLIRPDPLVLCAVWPVPAVASAASG
ncbi:hypothetical protein ACLB1M_04965 [Escherichia coli]